jgi:hypothetical protein
MVREFSTARAKEAEVVAGVFRGDENEFRAPKERDLFCNPKLKTMFVDISYDPDGDGFNFGVVESFTMVKRGNFFSFIRK